MMDSNDEWPMSLEEYAEGRRQLYSQLSFEGLLEKLGITVHACLHANFTHRVACPFHKGGQERTPSFYLSEENKDFYCFSCSARGDLFDFMQRIYGIPWFFIVRDMLKKQGVFSVELGEQSAPPDRELIFKSDLELSRHIRKYLEKFTDTAEYEAEKAWAESLFFRMDERFAKLNPFDHTSIMSFKMLIWSEIYRREKDRIR